MRGWVCIRQGHATGACAGCGVEQMARPRCELRVRVRARALQLPEHLKLAVVETLVAVDIRKPQEVLCDVLRVV